MRQEDGKGESQMSRFGETPGSPVRSLKFQITLHDYFFFLPVLEILDRMSAIGAEHVVCKGGGGRGGRAPSRLRVTCGKRQIKQRKEPGWTVSLESSAYSPHLGAKVSLQSLLRSGRAFLMQSLDKMSRETMRPHKRARNFPLESQGVNLHSKGTKKTSIQDNSG